MLSGATPSAACRVIGSISSVRVRGLRAGQGGLEGHHARAERQDEELHWLQALKTQYLNVVYLSD